MKKKAIGLALAVLLLLGLSLPAMAEPEAPASAGFYLIGDTPSGVEVVGVAADKTAITASTLKPTPESEEYVFFPGSEQLKVTLSSTDSAKQYAIFLTAGDTITESTIKYIDQQGNGSSLTFYVYPATLTVSTELTLWITSSGAGPDDEPVQITLGFYVPYVLGDVNSDGEPDAIDATFILQYTVNLKDLEGTELLAGDVNLDGDTDAIDATYILQYTVNLINSFDEVQH